MKPRNRFTNLCVDRKYHDWHSRRVSTHFPRTKYIPRTNPMPITSSEDDEQDVVCYICCDGDFKRFNKILLCDGDGCKNAVHQRCHNPILRSVPAGSWYCMPCVEKQTPVHVVMSQTGSEKNCINYDKCKVSLVVPPQDLDSAAMKDGGIWRCPRCAEEDNEDKAAFWAELEELIAHGRRVAV